MTPLYKTQNSNIN